MQRVHRLLAEFKAFHFSGEALLAHHRAQEAAHHLHRARLEFASDLRELLGAALRGARGGVGGGAFAARERKCPHALHGVDVVADPRVALRVRRSDRQRGRGLREVARRWRWLSGERYLKGKGSRRRRGK